MNIAEWARLKRRGIAMIVAGVVLFAGTVYQGYQRGHDRQHFETCMVDNFAALSRALAARDDLGKINSDAVGGVFDAALGATDGGPVIRALGEWHEAQDRIAAILKDHPLPKLPEGRCNS